jgi:diadenylate cyclase
MKPQKSDDHFPTIFDVAARLAADVKAEALLVIVEGEVNWKDVKARAAGQQILVAAETAEQIDSAHKAELPTVVLDMADAPVLEKVAQALLECVARELLQPGAGVVAVYSGFEPDQIDSVSVIQLQDHLGRLSSRDLRQLQTQVPLDTLKTVVDLAVEIGREGREGKPVGTMFVVGDTRKVLAHSHPAGYDPVKGYGRKDRDLGDPRVREAVKEIAPLDGAFIVSPDGVVEKACQLVDAAHANLTLSAGLGARHWAAAAISKNTKAISVVVSESNGTVRIFQNGSVVLRIEPLRRAMIWRDFEFEPPRASLGDEEDESSAK